MLKDFNIKIAECKAELEAAENAARDAQQILMQSGRTLSNRPLDLKAIVKAQSNKAAAAELLDNAQIAAKDARLKLEDAEKAKYQFLMVTMPDLARTIETLKGDLPAARHSVAEAKQRVTVAESALANTQAQLKRLSSKEAAARADVVHAQEVALAHNRNQSTMAARALEQLEQRIAANEATLKQWLEDPDYIAERQARLRQAHGMAG